MPHPDHEQNRRTWNEIVPLHVTHPSYLTQHLLRGGSSLKSIELAELGDVRSKTLLHLMCQFGLDTLSWARLGAKVTGVDISDKSIEYARELAIEAGIDATFIRSDLFDLIGTLDDKFDIVFQSYGTYMWLSDMMQWARVIAHLLKPGGTFLIVDEHPCSILFQETELNYFSKEPERLTDTPDYADTSYIVKGEKVEWQHTLSEIFNALIDAGLTIERFQEFDFGYYQVKNDWYQKGEFWYPPTGPTPYPLLMAIRARK
jgi:SAM-dependent methyltransferase